MWATHALPRDPPDAYYGLRWLAMAARQVLCHFDDANLWSLCRGPDPKHTALNIRCPIWEFFIAPNIVSSSLAGWLCLRIRGVDDLWFWFYLWLVTSVTAPSPCFVSDSNLLPWLPTASKTPPFPRMAAHDSKLERASSLSDPGRGSTTHLRFKYTEERILVNKEILQPAPADNPKGPSDP